MRVGFVLGLGVSARITEKLLEIIRGVAKYVQVHGEANLLPLGATRDDRN